uniref:RNA-directed DNA polymerase n=1 Tax=Photinus pyralis TaxID=7054 RepID=A0A1Y1M360_PHOPY
MAWRVEENILYKYVQQQYPELQSEANHWKIVVPKPARRQLLARYHDHPTAGHVGVYKTYWKLCEQHYWPKMKDDVVKYIKNCTICAEYKPDQLRAAGLMGDRPKIKKPWQMISLDFIGPFPRSNRGYKYVLVVTDYFSKYVVTFPLRNATAKQLVNCIEEGIFLVYGTPQFNICDNGVQMKSKEFQQVCKDYRAQIFYTALYYPRANPTERVNRVIKTMIASYIKGDQKKWCKNLAAVTCAIRTSRHEITEATPYFINFGREHKLYGKDFENQVPEDAINANQLIEQRQIGYRKMFDRVRERLKSAREHNAQTYNLRRRHVEYTVGQKVWRRNKALSDATADFNSKLAPKYIGPFIIKRKTGYCTYELQDDHNKSKGMWHVQDLKPHYSHENG